MGGQGRRVDRLRNSTLDIAWLGIDGMSDKNNLMSSCGYLEDEAIRLVLHTHLKF